MSIQGAINQAIGTAALVKKLQQDSPRQVNKQVKTLMDKAGSEGVQQSKDWGKSIYNKMENIEGQYPLVQFPKGYAEAKARLAEKIAERNLQQYEVSKQKDYLDQPTSMGGSLRDLKLNPEQLKQVEKQLKGD